MENSTDNELFRRRPETVNLIRYLRDIPIGETVSYAVMTEQLSGCNAQYSGRHMVESAVKTLWSEGVFWVNVHGVGLKRIDSSEAVKYTRERHKRRFVGDTKLMRNRVEAVDPASLNTDGRRAFALAVAELGLRETIASKETDRLLNENIAKRPAQSLGPSKDAGMQMIKGFLESGVVG